MQSLRGMRFCSFLNVSRKAKIPSLSLARQNSHVRVLSEFNGFPLKETFLEKTSLLQEFRQWALFVNTTKTNWNSSKLNDIMSRLGSTCNNDDWSPEETTHALHSWTLLANASPYLSSSLLALEQQLVTKCRYWLFSAQSELNTLLSIYTKLNLVLALCTASPLMTRPCVYPRLPYRTTSYMDEDENDASWMWHTYLMKTCDRTRSSGMFKRLDPQTFILFTHLLLRCENVKKEFHDFFYLFKFLDFFDSLASEHIALVLNAFNKHNICLLPFSHPYRDKLALMLVQRLVHNFHNNGTESHDFEKSAMGYLVNRSPTKSINENLRDLQRVYLSRGESASTEMLLATLYLALSTDCLEPKLLDYIFKSRLINENENDFGTISNVFKPSIATSVLRLGYRIFSEEQRKILVDRIVAQTRHKLETIDENDVAYWAELSGLGAMLASMGRYETSLFQRIFSNKALFTPEDSKEDESKNENNVEIEQKDEIKEVQVAKRVMFGIQNKRLRRVLSNLQFMRAIMNIDRTTKKVEMSPELPVISTKSLREKWTPACKMQFPEVFKEFLELIKQAITEELKPISLENIVLVPGLTAHDFIINLSDDRRMAVVVLDKTYEGVFNVVPSAELALSRALDLDFVCVDFDLGLIDELRLLDDQLALERVHQALEEIKASLNST